MYNRIQQSIHSLILSSNIVVVVMIGKMMVIFINYIFNNYGNVGSDENLFAMMPQDVC